MSPKNAQAQCAISAKVETKPHFAFKNLPNQVKCSLTETIRSRETMTCTLRHHCWQSGITSNIKEMKIVIHILTRFTLIITTL